MGIVKMEPHFLAAYLASETACSVLEIMPDTDLVEELRNLIYIQNELMSHLIEGKHYGTDNITSFVEFTQEVKQEISRIRNEEY